MDTVQPHPEWKILVKEFALSDYGLFVTHANVQALIGFDRSDKRYYRTTQRWKKAMLNDHSKEIETVWNEGYRLVEPDQYRHRSRRHFLLGKKRISVGTKVAAAAPIELMSSGEKQKMIEFTQLIGTVDYFMEESLKKTLKLQKQPEQQLADVVGKALDVAD